MKKKNISRDQLIKDAVDAGICEATMLDSGALSVRTGKYTGRYPDAKFIVHNGDTENTVDWKSNKGCTGHEFSALRERMLAYMSHENVYVQNLYAGRDEDYQIGLTVHTSMAWQALFANNMFVRTRRSLKIPQINWEILCCPEFQEDPRVIVNFTNRQVIITGTYYAGEIKKSIFTVLNYILPGRKVLPMHCSVNTGPDGLNPAIFFGLSGTGKTTLSAEPGRVLVGDDEHGWSPSGIFNFEGGCYAKVFELTKENEPEIWNAVQRKGSILENVVIDDQGKPSFESCELTQNARGSYPISHIPNVAKSGTCKHPKNIVFLTCDAFGVLPPVSRLEGKEIKQHFLMGYTAKVAGTEKGISEPVATFSCCFGAPFMPLHASVYAGLLQDKVEKHGVNCWLVNTGWVGGKYGIGSRIPLSASRKIIEMILDGSLALKEFKKHRYTGLSIPESMNELVECSHIPEKNWQDISEYELQVLKLMGEWTKVLEELSTTGDER